MADTLSRLFGPANAANGTSTVFTGTAAHTYTIKHIVWVNPTAGAITVKLGIGGVADANLVIAATSIPAGGRLEWSGLLITSGTETIQANTTATGTTISASGLDQS